LAAHSLLDSGEARVAERGADGAWTVNQWLKKAVLLSFRLNDMEPIPGGPGHATWWDKVPSKFEGWGEAELDRGRLPRRAQLHRAPLGLYRAERGADAQLRQSRRLCRLTGTMVDTWATVGSCAQIGKNVHLSGGVGIGGVLEPMQAGPTIIEDNCFIGARSEVVEGCIVREGSVLGMGVYIGQSTKIVDRATGEIFMGEVPPYSVVVSGTMPGKPLPDGEPGAEPLLRRDRQACRRAHPLQDLHQRAAARSGAGIVLALLGLARVLRVSLQWDLQCPATGQGPRC
jgi:2,3,4,5-tetrahydropyridine-2-carboxylate N-succinyltransferase